MLGHLNRQLPRAAPLMAAALLLLLATAAALLVLPAAAAASRTQETIFQDDPRITYERDPVKLENTMRLVKALGVDRIRITVLWDTIAPRPGSETRPRFGSGGAGWPGAYPPGAWDRLDNLVRTANRMGLKLLFNVTGGAPAWATPGRHGRREGVVRPSAREFGLFVRAVGLRYSGFWPDQALAPDPPEKPKPLFEVPGIGITIGEEPEPTQAPQPVPRIPRVDHWSIWNEPNFPSWLLPGWERAGRRTWRTVAPHQYRRLVNSAWAQLQDTSHRNDVILLGETAPFGPKRPRRPGGKGLVSPLHFVSDMYCLDRRYRAYRGSAARARSCPATRGARRRFRANNPALFRATGWAHHPYSLDRPPNWKGRRRDAATLGVLHRLTRALDRSHAAWRSRSRWPIWITEYGYQTKPPDPVFGVSWRRQAAWMSWAEFLAFRNSRVASYAQFLLDDDKPSDRDGDAGNEHRRWHTWQSGLRTNAGRAKPALTEFPIPIYVDPSSKASRGDKVRVFSNYRPAAPGAGLTARVMFTPRRGGERTLRSFRVRNRQNYLNVFIRSPGRGKVRVTWEVPRVGRRATRAIRLGR